MAKRKRTNPNRRPMTVADLKKVEQSCIRNIMILSITIGAMAAHDCFDFGPKRLGLLVDEMLKKYQDLDDGLFTANDSLQWLEDYAHISMREVTDQ